MLARPSTSKSGRIGSAVAGISIRPADVLKKAPVRRAAGEDVSLMLDLAILGVPAHNILLAAAEALWVGEAMQQVVAEFVCEREVDPPFRGDGFVVDDAPSPCGRRAP